MAKTKSQPLRTLLSLSHKPSARALMHGHTLAVLVGEKPEFTNLIASLTPRQRNMQTAPQSQRKKKKNRGGGNKKNIPPRPLFSLCSPSPPSNTHHTHEQLKPRLIGERLSLSHCSPTQNCGEKYPRLKKIISFIACVDVSCRSSSSSPSSSFFLLLLASLPSHIHSIITYPQTISAPAPSRARTPPGRTPAASRTPP